MVQVTPLKTLASSLQSEWHAGSKTLLQQNPPVLNWQCRLTLLVLNNGHKVLVGPVVVVVVVMVVVLSQKCTNTVMQLGLYQIFCSYSIR